MGGSGRGIFHCFISAFISGVGKNNENPSKVSLSYLKILGARRMRNEASFVLRIPISLI
jgi:hypothetical protein